MGESVEERVKACLQCGTVLPFDAELCSLCGASARPGAAARAFSDPEPIKPCLACQSLIAESALFCPDCGDFTLSVAVPDFSSPPLGAEEASAVTLLSRLVAVLFAVSAAAILVVSVLDFMRVRAVPA